MWPVMDWKGVFAMRMKRSQDSQHKQPVNSSYSIKMAHERTQLFWLTGTAASRPYKHNVRANLLNPLRQMCSNCV